MIIDENELKAIGIIDENNTSRGVEKVKNINDITGKKRAVSHSIVSLILKIIALLVIVGGSVAGLYQGIIIKSDSYFSRTYTEYSFLLSCVWWAIYFVSGTFIYGFSTIIELLFSINNKLNE